MPGFLFYVLIGFLAQLVDGTAGMGYGLSCRSFLRLFFPFPVDLLSAVVHWAELPVSLVSGISHLFLGNVDRSLLLRLLLPGVLGGLCGSLLLLQIGKEFENFISFYLLLMGLLVFFRALRSSGRPIPWFRKGLLPLALFGGFLDALGGGGWGQIVGGTLLAGGEEAKKSIGSVNLSEAFVTLTEAVVFFFMLGGVRSCLPVIFGLISGGILAAPLAAWCCIRVPVRPLLAAVGLLIVFSNLRPIFIP
ncbi:MAG: sulfite exporter TauE/SafE family protein [Bacillota bacterium]|nr:sulfite exporter TauE/SafE family protein [Bacillota bacterium]